MAGVWKRDGTIAVTKGSKKVVGTGTTFADPKNAAAKGHLLVMVTGTAVDLYEVDYSESNSVFYLVEAYRGDTGTGKAYAIDTSRTDSIPEFARRLNATLGAYQQQGDAFQALLTSDAATIEVTAPDGTKHTMIPWKRVTSEGEGQAARAKVEADKAAASAALAGGIVEASALPLPEVWAPLSDSLRMITGYGREVKVGDDVVAQMVGFSRNSTATYIGKDGQLKTAAANEPRFEKDGLLLEGPSTNIVTNSNVFTTYVAGTTKVEEQPGPFGANDATRVNTVNTYGGINLFLSASLIDGAVYTTSVWLRGAVGGEAIRIGIHNSTTGLGVTLTTEWKRYSITQTRLAGANAACVIQTVVGGSSFFVYGAQLEALPFASSYIPTNGAAVTRVADVAQLPALGNMAALGFAVSAEFDTQRAGVSYTSENTCLFSMEQIDRARMAVLRGKYGSGDDGYGFATHCGAYGQAGYVMTVLRDFTVKDRKGVVVISEGGGFLKMRVNSSFSSVSSSTATAAPLPNTIYLGAFGGGGLQPLFGHLRNLRIWQRPLTDAQLKAIA